ncbi:MAG: hypothetical protein IH991_18075, partial [Planctomycetes bacterium]|nr:hypothetical protein [Planctomycetota bacterium]
PENNAAIFFWRAVGPSEYKELYEWLYSSPHFKAIGARQLPGQGNYFLSLGDYLDGPARDKVPIAEGESQEVAINRILKQEEQALTRPWSKKDFPILHQWLESNKEPLRLVALGAERPRYYWPLDSVADKHDEDAVVDLVDAYPGLYDDYLTWNINAIARALVMRSMLQLHEGDFAKAWRDLLTCHRLGRLVTQGPTMRHFYFGIYSQSLAFEAEAAMAHHGFVTRERAAKIQRARQDLPTAPSFVDKVNFAERLELLDIASRAPRKNISFWRILEGQHAQTWSMNVSGKMILKGTDWDEVLRRCNSWHDDIVNTAKQVSRGKGVKAQAKLLDQYVKIVMSAKRPLRTQTERLKAFAKLRSFLTERASSLLIARVASPHVLIHKEAEMRLDIRERLNRIVFALEDYRRDHRKYPEKLAQLQQKHLEHLPRDLHGNGEFRYRPNDVGYLLYSVGPDGEDGYQAAPANRIELPFGFDTVSEFKDEIIIRTPQKKK